MFTKIFRNRFKDYDKHDEIVDTDGETYIVYKPEERWKSFIKEYAVYINDDSKFLKISLSPIVEYINVEIVCYRGNKIFKIISFLNEINRKQDQYMLKLPDSTEEVKLNVREVNGARYSDLDLLKRDVLWRSIVSSIILASISSLILFIFRLSTIQFINEYFDWNYVYQVLFYEPWIYLYLVLAIIVFGLILFAILYIPNCLKYRRAQFNRTKNLRIDKVLRFKVKHTSKGTFNNYTIKLKKKRKMHLLDAMCLVTCKDENDELIKEYKLHIKKRGTRFRISGVNKYTKLNVEVDVLTADFKKYYYNGEFRRKVTKKGVSCKFLTLRGFEKATTLFGVAVLAISAFSIYKYLDLRNVNVSLQNYEFDIEVENQDIFNILIHLKEKLFRNKWEEMYELAKKYYDNFNNLEVPYNFRTFNGYEYDENGYKLGTWIISQRTSYNKGILSTDRFEKLSLIGMRFSTKKGNRKSWEEMYELTKTYYEYYGNLDVPTTFKTTNGIDYDEKGVKLRNWINGQFQKMFSKRSVLYLLNIVDTPEEKEQFEKINVLTDEQYYNLISIGFRVNSYSDNLIENKKS